MADLSTTVNGVKLRNPVLPASGPLGCDAVALRHLEALGVGAMVAKTISAKAAVVAKPCIQRVGKDGMLNCETWSEKTWETWVEQELPTVQALRAAGCPVISSIGYHPHEIEMLAEKVAPFCDIIEISTHYVGDSPEPIIAGVKAAKKGSGGHIPVWIKMSPHASAMADYARAAENAGADSIVAINSVGPCQSFDPSGKPFLGSAGGWGWLTGTPIKPVAQHFVRQVVEAVKVPVIGVGGIGSAKDVLEMLYLGASAVQICTAPMLRGPKLFTKIVNDLAVLLDKEKALAPAAVVGRSASEFVNTADDYDAKVEVSRESSCVDCMLCEGACAYLAMHVAPVPKGQKSESIPIGKHVWIDYDRCVHCGACVSVCPAPGTLGVIPGLKTANV
jgi:dihydroorotate dehydrogenase (NAD+) catalytic subunit